MFQPLYATVATAKPWLVPLCFVTAWSFILMLIWSLWAAVRDAVKGAAQLHQIPCANCQFFTDNCLLKCTVHPEIALSEQAIDCPDYRAMTSPLTLKCSEPS